MLVSCVKGRTVWCRIFHAFGKVARLVVAAGALGLWPRRGFARRAQGGKHTRSADDFLGDLVDSGDHRLSSAALTAAVETGRALLNRPSVRASLEGAVLRLLGGAPEQLHT